MNSRRIGWRPVTAMLLLLWLSGLMLEICLSYWPWQADTGFLILKQDVVELTHWRVAFQTHVATSMLVLLAGLTQFWPIFRQRYRHWHRRLGYVYVGSVLGLAAPTGLVMAFYASGGWSVQLCFVLLSVLWVISTVQALRRALAKQWLQHEIWMIRSYALTLVALSLRTWKLGLYELAPYVDWLTPRHIYQLEAWLALVINLCVAEWIIRERIHRTRQRLSNVSC